ncbi:MAG: hypothetical protein HY370_09290 [Proteobacteria bacterium]|nr:hypothetical protein [Pseudomonadota bacterium]
MPLKAEYSQTDKGLLDRMTRLYAQESVLGKNICGGTLCKQLSEDARALDNNQLADAGVPGLLPAQRNINAPQVASPALANNGPTTPTGMV